MSAHPNRPRAQDSHTCCEGEMNWNTLDGCTAPVRIQRGREGGTRILVPFRSSGICERIEYVHCYLYVGSENPFPLSRFAVTKGRALPDVRR